MWFNEIAASKDPGRDELSQFVRNVRNFLGYVLEDKENFAFLWENSPDLYKMALETFSLDIAEGAGLDLDLSIPEISSKNLHIHGLEGRPLKFKFRVLNSIGNQWEEVKARSSVRGWFKKIIEAIDAILDSLIAAAGGAGGIIKEFKAALSSLA
ncbi:MAG: hypothetical protein ABIE47_04800 [Pseudomonadota bacterium]